MRRQLLFLFQLQKLPGVKFWKTKVYAKFAKDIMKRYGEIHNSDTTFGHDILVIKSLFFLFSREFYNEYYEGNFINLKGEYTYALL